MPSSIATTATTATTVRASASSVAPTKSQPYVLSVEDLFEKLRLLEMEQQQEQQQQQEQESNSHSHNRHNRHRHQQRSPYPGRNPHHLIQIDAELHQRAQDTFQDILARLEKQRQEHESLLKDDSIRLLHPTAHRGLNKKTSSMTIRQSHGNANLRHCMSDDGG
ncbi:hypothetical protein BGZ94_004671 [Podila epigama]|nr:hypothetical protein BGZ94_004671 [Podila epigama]